MTPFDVFLQNKELYELLIKLFQIENSKINLSSFNDYNNILHKHIIDSLHILKLIKIQDINNFNIADIGSGGGFPGLALAIAIPNCQFYLIESITKKCNAINTIIKQLNLQNVFTKNIRAEELNEKYDIVISRAVAKFNTIYDWSKHICKHMGRIYLYKSTNEVITGYKQKYQYEILNDNRIIYEF